MDILIQINREWYWPYCNLKSPLIIQFVNIRIICTNVDLWDKIKRFHSIKRAVEEHEKATDFLEELKNEIY